MAKTGRILFWSPRMLAILYIAFLSLFSLDVLNSDAGFRETAAGLIVHNIPSLILAAAVLIAWRHEWFGWRCFYRRRACVCRMDCFQCAYSRADGTIVDRFDLGPVASLGRSVFYRMAKEDTEQSVD